MEMKCSVNQTKKFNRGPEVMVYAYIPDTWNVEIRGTWFKVSPGKKKEES
jgi:hypothetical protein